MDRKIRRPSEESYETTQRLALTSDAEFDFLMLSTLRSHESVATCIDTSVDYLRRNVPKTPLPETVISCRRRCGDAVSVKEWRCASIEV